MTIGILSCAWRRCALIAFGATCVDTPKLIDGNSDHMIGDVAAMWPPIVLSFKRDYITDRQGTRYPIGFGPSAAGGVQPTSPHR